MKYQIAVFISLTLSLVLTPHLSVSAAERQSPEKKVFYRCAAGKTILARYWLGEPGRVVIKLGDGRKMTLPQVIAASGIKYSKNEDVFVFWSKGDSAFILENDQITYRDCKGSR